MDSRKNDDKRAKTSNKLATVPGVLAVDYSDGTFVRRTKALAQQKRAAQADETTSLQHTSKPKSASESDSENTEIDLKLGQRTGEVKRTKQKHAVATAPGVLAVDYSDGTFVRRTKALAQQKRAAQADETSSLQHTSKPKSASESDSENTDIDRKLGHRTGEVKRTKQKHAVATVPGVLAVDDSDRTFVRRTKALAQQKRAAQVGETSSSQPPRRADGIAKRIQHAQGRADSARLRNKYSLENEEKIAEDDDTIAAPGTVKFMRNGNKGGDLEAGAAAEEGSIVHAVLVENPSDEEISVEELLFAEATALLPLYRQKRVWLVVVLVVGIIVAMIIILSKTGDQKSAPPAPTTATPIEDRQRSALLQFHGLFGGENWTVVTGWSPSSDNMCLWNGVECKIGTNDELTKVKELALPANNLIGNIEDLASSINGLVYLERLDLDSNLIVGNWTALGSNLALSSTLDHVDLRLNELTGSVAIELCGSLGDGILHVDCDVECECCNHGDLCEGGECVDVPGWHNSFGEQFNCTWYGADGGDICGDNGSCCENEGHTANTACCACGGGTKVPLSNQSPSSAPSTFQQRDVLVALYNATNGDGWLSSTNWLSDEPICDWYRVDCNSDGYVYRIDLYNNTLQGTIPTELGLLKSLQRLWVYDNSLTGTIPTELGLLTSLKWLYVHRNSLTGTIPTELGLLTSLQKLWVENNYLTGAVPNEVCALRPSPITGGSLVFLEADCVEEVECTCCSRCY